MGPPTIYPLGVSRKFCRFLAQRAQVKSITSPRPRAHKSEKKCKVEIKTNVMEHVEEFLKHIGLHEYADAFFDNDYDSLDIFL